MNILAIDYGKKRIGLAWCQKELGVVLPYGVIEGKEELVELIKTEKIDKLIVGLPLGLDGKENENTKRVREFASEIEKTAMVSVEFVDERFSSHQADRMGGEASRDEKAAMILLEAWLEKK
jgi:putative Holliday junction resolvase